MRRSQWPFSRMSLLISSLRSRILVGRGGGGECDAVWVCELWRRVGVRCFCPVVFCSAASAAALDLPRNRATPTQSAPVLAQPSVLDLHDLLPDLPQDLLPPFVCFVQVAAFGGEVGPPLFGTALVCFLPRQEPIEHRLRLLRITCHISELLRASKGSVRARPRSFAACCFCCECAAAAILAAVPASVILPLLIMFEVVDSPLSSCARPA